MLEHHFAVLFLAGTIDSVPEGAANARLRIAADSGAEHARSLGISIDAIVGDLDSISTETVEYYRGQGTKIVHVPDQDHNDLEKALMYLSKEWKGQVHIFGMTGGRADHTLSNFSVMLRYSDRFEALIAQDAFGSYSFLTTKNNSVAISCESGDKISLIPFGEAQGIVTTNLHYPLNEETLRLGEREGLSNVATGSPVEISIERGALLVTVLKYVPE